MCFCCYCFCFVLFWKESSRTWEICSHCFCRDSGGESGGIRGMCEGWYWIAKSLQTTQVKGAMRRNKEAFIPSFEAERKRARGRERIYRYSKQAWKARNLSILIFSRHGSYKWMWEQNRFFCRIYIKILHMPGIFTIIQYLLGSPVQGSGWQHSEQSS